MNSYITFSYISWAYFAYFLFYSSINLQRYRSAQWIWLDNKRYIKAHMNVLCTQFTPHPKFLLSQISQKSIVWLPCWVLWLGIIDMSSYLSRSHFKLRLMLNNKFMSYGKIVMLKCLTFKICLFLNQWKVGMTKGW